MATPFAAIPDSTLTGDFPILDQSDQRERRIDPASILATVPRAGLFDLKGVDVVHAHFLTRDDQRIAVDDGGNPSPRVGQSGKRDQAEEQGPAHAERLQPISAVCNLLTVALSGKQRPDSRHDCCLVMALSCRDRQN